jgi:single-strand DNA-binding protein
METTMAEGMNRATLIGNLGADPELRYTQSNTGVLKFRIATTESYKDADGNRQENTQWHQIVLWGKRGEALANILRKGSRCCIEGRIENRSYDGDDGVKRYVSEVVATNIVLLDSRQDGEQRQGNNGNGPRQSNGNQQPRGNGNRQQGTGGGNGQRQGNGQRPPQNQQARGNSGGNNNGGNGGTSRNQQQRPPQNQPQSQGQGQGPDDPHSPSGNEDWNQGGGADDDIPFAANRDQDW